MIKNTILIFERMKDHFFLTNQDNEYTKNNKTNTIPSYALFIGVILFYILFMLIKQPSWTLSGEMWAEMATNYYLNANSTSLYMNFFATDSGYMSFPQRIIAFLGNKLSLSASVIPYYYTWSAIILTAIMVGSFCLPVFKKLVKSDFLRFLVALSILVVVDFETRTFINFTYLVAFFGAIIISLSLVQNNSEKVPLWSWTLPFLVVSKPAVLSILPIMLIASISSNNRFRLITLVTIIFVTAQFVQLSISVDGGTFAHMQSIDVTLFAKLLATTKYFFGFLGGYILGPVSGFDKNYKLFAGMILFFVLTIIFLKIRFRNNALILVGLSLIFSNVLLNSFAMPIDWNINIHNLNSLPLYRHIIVAYFGAVLVIAGVVSHSINLKFIKNVNLLQLISIFLFLLWFIFSGWLNRGLEISNEPKSPTLNSSHWQEFSSLIDSNEESVCVQINPIQWVYGRDCKTINQGLIWGANEYKSNSGKNLEFEISKEKKMHLNNFNIQSFSILIKPNSNKSIFVNAMASLETEDKEIFNFYGQAEISASGGTLTFTKSERLSVENISKINIYFNIPVDIAMNQNIPSILWMGK